MSAATLRAWLNPILLPLLLLAGTLFINPSKNNEGSEKTLGGKKFPQVIQPPKNTSSLREVELVAASMVPSAVKVSQLPPIPSVDNPRAVNAWLRKVDAASSRLTVKSLGRSAAGQEILGAYTEIDDAGQKPPATAPYVAVICRQHGDEPAPTAAALELISEVVTTQATEKYELLKQVRFFIVPVVNPDGALEDYRYSHEGVNPNRDWGIWRLAETKAVWESLKQIRPAALLDCHELLPGDYKTHPYLECFAEGEALAKHLASANPKQSKFDALQIRGPIRECPPSLLYQHFQRTYKRPAVMVESSMVGKRTFQQRVQLHHTAAWETASWVARTKLHKVSYANMKIAGVLR